MPIGCIPGASSPEDLLRNWERVKFSYNDVLAQVNETLEKDEIDNDSLIFGKGILERQRKTAEKIHDEAMRLHHDETSICCGCSSKQIKAYVITGIETLTGLAATVAAIASAASPDTTTEAMATTLAVCSITTLALSKIKDYLFRTWGLEEKTQKTLLKIQSEACIITNTDATILLIEHMINTAAAQPDLNDSSSLLSSSEPDNKPPAPTKHSSRHHRHKKIHDKKENTNLPSLAAPNYKPTSASDKSSPKLTTTSESSRIERSPPTSPRNRLRNAVSLLQEQTTDANACRFPQRKVFVIEKIEKYIRSPKRSTTNSSSSLHKSQNDSSLELLYGPDRI